MSSTRTRLMVPACLSLLGSSYVGAATWVDGPAFSASPEELIKVAGQIPIQAGFAVQELLEDSRITLDDMGRRTTRYHYIFRIDRESAIEGWGAVAANYTTWLQEKPMIRARVITPDGKVHMLDPATIGDFSPEQKSSEMFTDRRQLRAPLPKLVKGAIAEVEIFTRDHRPFSTSGSLGSFSLWQPVPVYRTRFTLDVPAAANLKWKFQGLAGFEARPQIVDGRNLLSVELGPTQPGKKNEPSQAPGQNLRPTVFYSTTPTWEIAAAEYSETVEAQLKGAQLQAWVRQAVGETLDRMEILKRLVARMHKEVRYIGLEFGEASVVPRAPGETLKRGYGDCKDKSALLVAILREAGIPAHLALLRVGAAEDVEVDMPGLSAFDHAIVFVPGAPAIWIDPTEPEAPVGELPVADLGRRALVIGNPSAGLLTIPEIPAARNVYRETKEVYLADNGFGRIIETTEAQGPSEIYLRNGYLGADPKNTRESLKTYSERTFKAKELGRLEYAHPEDMSLPFRLVLEAQKVGIANTGTMDAAVSVNAWPLVDNLSSTVQESNKEEGDENETGTTKESKANDTVAPRQTDLMFWAAHIKEARWIIHPPIGYAHDALPANQTLAFGPATLTLAYQGNPDGTVEANFRMECPKRRWSPKEVDKARAALKAYGESKVPMVVFQQVGESYLGAGQIKEALAEFRKLQTLAPGKADPLTRLARAQLAASLGESARETIKNATRLEPTCSNAFQVQGWVLQHDWLGRRFRLGWDRKGAVAAYRQALVLDPKNRFVKENLAILLEHNSGGERFVPGPDLDESIRLYKELIEEEKTDSLQDNLMVCLSKQGRLAEAQEVARIREASPRRNAWLIGLEACLNGLDKAKDLGRTVFPDLATRRAAYLGAAEIALLNRKYADASALLNEGAAGASNMTQVKARAESLARVKPFGGTPLDLKDPRDVVRSMFLALGEQKLSEDRLKVFLSEAALTPVQIKKAIKEQSKVAVDIAKQGLPIPVMLDISCSLSDFTMDGDDRNGYIVRAELPGQNPTEFYVARFGNSCRLIGNELSDLARQSYWHVKRGELVPARACLNLLLKEARKPDSSDPLSGHLICRMWEQGREGTAEEIRLAAACVLAMDKDEPEAMEDMKRAFNVNLSEAQMGAVAQSLARGAIRRKDWGTLSQASARLVSKFPNSLIAFNWQIESLISSRKWLELIEVMDAAMVKHPDDQDLPGRKLYYLKLAGRSAESESQMADLIARGKAKPSDFNNLAWWQVVRGKTDSRTLEYARRAVQGNGASSSAAHHTLATILAESGRTSEALEFLLKAVALRDEDNPTGVDWYVLGRIAEHLGETGAAESYYRRVEIEPEDLGPSEDSCFALAKRRLEILKKGIK